VGWPAFVGNCVQLSGKPQNAPASTAPNAHRALPATPRLHNGAIPRARYAAHRLAGRCGHEWPSPAAPRPHHRLTPRPEQSAIAHALHFNLRPIPFCRLLDTRHNPTSQKNAGILRGFYEAFQSGDLRFEIFSVQPFSGFLYGGFL